MTNTRSRNAAIALFLSAAVILLGVFTHSWFRADRGDGGIGLTGIEECRHGECRSASWGDLGSDIPSEIPLFGYVGLIGGLLAAGAAVATGVLLLRGTGRRMPMKLVSGAFAIAAFGQIAFINRIFSAGDLKGVSLGWSMFAAVGGMIGAAVITKLMVMPAIAAESGASPVPPAPHQPYTIG